MRVTEGLTLALALTAAGFAILMEGGTLPQYGGLAIAVAGFGLVVLSIVEAGGTTSRPAKLAFGLLLLLVVWHATPMPGALRGAVSPGQAALLDRVAPEWEGPEREGPPEAAGSASGGAPAAEAFSRWLTECDIASALGDPVPPYDPLRESTATAWRPGSLLPSGLPWALAQIVGVLAIFALGCRIGAVERLQLPILGVLLLFAVAQAVFGIAMRDGPSTGIGTKMFYLGSATGTFINRGHFAVFLALGVGAAWALAGSQFPLLPAEVERHQQRARRSSQPPSVFEASGNRIPKLVLIGLLTAVLGVGMVSSQSRGPLIWVVLCSVACGLWLRRERNERFYLSFALWFLVVTGALGTLVFGFRGAFGRFFGLLGGAAADVSASSRMRIWQDGLEAFVDAPLFGAGLGAWRLAYGARESVAHLYDVKHAHSEVVEWLAEGGIVGLLALLIATGAWVRSLGASLRGEHSSGTCVAAGAGVGVLTAIGCSLGDFPMHTPGSALSVALFAGLGTGVGLQVPVWARSVRFVVGGAALALGLQSAWADRDEGGSRQERLGEIPLDFLRPQAVSGPADARERWSAAQADVAAAPLDPWRHLRLARAAAWMGREFPLENYAFQAELALARVEALRPQDGRAALVAAAVLLDLRGEKACRQGRARDLLARAVRLDPWRAEAAFKLADVLPLRDLEVIGAGRGKAPGAAKVDYALGLALARRREASGAAAAYQRAAAADPSFAPPFFQLAATAHAAGDEETTRRRVQQFLAGRDRPGGMEGWAYLLVGNLDAAESRLRASVAVLPANQWAWEGLAEVHFRRGSADREAEAWRAVLAIDPRHHKAGERLGLLVGSRPP